MPSSKPKQRTTPPARNADWRADYAHREYFLVPEQRVSPELVAQTVQRRVAGLRWLRPARTAELPVPRFAVLKIRTALGRPAGLDGLQSMTRDQLRLALLTMEDVEGPGA